MLEGHKVGLFLDADTAGKKELSAGDYIEAQITVEGRTVQITKKGTKPARSAKSFVEKRRYTKCRINVLPVPYAPVGRMDSGERL
jgi:hypothetical protein